MANEIKKYVNLDNLQTFKENADNLYASKIEFEELSGTVAYINVENNENIANPDVEEVTLTVDSLLSKTSTNPVQNKVITERINQISETLSQHNHQIENIDGFEEAVNDVITPAIGQSVSELESEIDAKKDKDLIVTFTDSTKIVATHTSEEIYEAINNGTTVYFNNGDTNFHYLEGTSSVVTFYTNYYDDDIMQADAYIIRGNQITQQHFQNSIITQDDIDSALSEKADLGHTHTIESIEGLQDAVNSAADSKFYIVTFDKGEDNQYHGDLTFAEIREKFEAGGNMVARIDGTDYIPLLSASPTQIIFSGIYQAQSVSLTINSNNVCTLSTTPLAHSSHNHDNLYYTENEIDGFLDEKQDVLTGTEGQIIKFDAYGKPVASDLEIPQSDWNQIDESANDYIKNRPFYEHADIIIDTITVNNGDTIDLNIYESIGDIHTNVTIVWDGISSETTIDWMTKLVGYYVIGDKNYLQSGIASTGEGYLLENAEDTSTTTIYCDDNPHTLSIIKNTLVKIDDKFLPDSLLRYESQELTDAQKTQALENIGGQSELVGVQGQLVGFDTDGKAIAIDADEISNESKLPITLGAFQYNNWGSLSGTTLNEKAQYLARFDVIVYQGALSSDLSMSGANYQRDLNLYTKALEYNPNLKVFGYITARGFATRLTGGHVGMTEYRTSPTNVDHPIWTKEELCEYMNLMAHCGGTRDTSTTDEYGNPIVTGGIPLYGVFFDDYDYHFNEDNTHIMNQGDWSTIREKHNFLIDYAHNLGMKVMPNSNPTLIFDNTATPDSIRNPNGEESHMGEDDWFCAESYFLRSDNTFNLNDHHVSDFRAQYKDTYKSKCLALTYVGAVSDDAEDNQQIASTFAIYQALCQGADSIALHVTDFVAEIPDEFTKYYDNNNRAVYSSGTGYYSLTVNGHTITASRSVAGTAYGEVPDAEALATCKVTVNGRTFNNIFADYDLPTFKKDVDTRFEALSEKVDQTSNLYHRAFIDDWQKIYTIDDYTNECFTFQNAFGGEDTGTTSSWNSLFPYNFQVRLPQQYSWRRVEMDATRLAGKTVELGFESCTAYLEDSTSTAVTNLTWQIVGVCDSNSNLTIASLNIGSSQKSVIDGVTRCCVKFTFPEDIQTLRFWVHRTAAEPTGAVIINAVGSYLVDVNEFPIKKTWFTNYAPPVSSWTIGSTYANITHSVDDDSVTVDYTQTSNCYELNTSFPVNTTIFQPGETWEIGVRDIRLIQPNTGLDVTSKINILFNLGTSLTNISIAGKTHSDYLNMTSDIGDGYIALSRFTVPEDYAGGMSATKMYIYTGGYVGGDANGMYQLYVKGLYLYKIDERDELFIRGEDASDTYIGINRVRTDTIDEKLKPDFLYVVDDGSMFITNFKGERINVGSVTQSDWNQGDESASDYIKNKPFYDYTETVIDNITVNNGDTLDFTIASFGNTGDIITIIWDGVAIDKTIGYCLIVNTMGYRLYTIGNQSLITAEEFLSGGDDTGEDYVIYSKINTSSSTLVCDDNPHTLSIIKHNITKIEDKFIPDTVARMTDIETDATLTQESKAADAKAVGDALQELREQIESGTGDSGNDNTADNLSVELSADELNELNSTITSLQSLKKANTSIIAFLTDLHMAGWTVEKIKKAVYGYNKISDSVKTDLLLFGGDYLDNSSATTKEQALTWYSDLRDILSYCNDKHPAAVIKGNHDDNTMYTDYVNGLIDFETFWDVLGNIDDDRTIRNTGNIEDCYGYYDIPNQKIRVFYINTVDIPQVLNEEANTINYKAQWDTGISIKQLQFIADNLKFDTSGWHVMLFSHHPIQYNIAIENGCGVTADRGGSALLELIDKFNTSNDSGNITVTGTDFSGTISYNFTENTDCKVIACINGHTHRDSVDVYNDSFFCISTRAVYGHPSYDGHISSSAYFVVDRNNYKLYMVYNGDGEENTFNYNSLITGGNPDSNPDISENMVEIESPFTFTINTVDNSTGKIIEDAENMRIASPIIGFTTPAVIDMSAYAELDDACYQLYWYNTDGSYTGEYGTTWVSMTTPINVPVDKAVRIKIRYENYYTWVEEHRIPEVEGAIKVYVEEGGEAYIINENELEPDAPVIELGKPLEDVLYLIGGSASAGSVGMDVYQNAPRMTALVTYGDKPITDVNALCDEEAYFISVPADATKITITSPNFIAGLQFLKYENDAYTKLADPGWQTLNSCTYSFTAGAYTHVAINYKNSNNTTIPTDTDTSGFSIVFE